MAMVIGNVEYKKQDEYYTPEYAVKPIIPYLGQTPKLVWCPFDTMDSAFVHLIRDAGHGVIATHIQQGEDFFTTNIDYADYIVSNPPFSNKTSIYKRLFELKKPFAMLVPLDGFCEGQERFTMFKDNGVQLLLLDKRTHFIRPDGIVKKGIPFTSVYVCHNFLPSDICFGIIDR